MAMCIPQGYGVPVPTGPNSYTWSGAPIWWDATSGPMPEHNSNLEDPRWVGSLLFGYPEVSSVATDHALFRAVYEVDTSVFPAVTYLCLSWVVKADPNVGSTADEVLVGFYRPGMDPMAFMITPSNAAVTKSAADPSVLDVFAGTESAPGVWKPVTKPSWLGDTKVWVDPTPSRRYPWAVQMRVPVKAAPSGLDLGNAFRMRFQVTVAAPGNNATFHKWPRTAPTILGADFGNPISSLGWDDFQLGTGGACAGGVSLEWGDVGTLNTSSSQILFSGGSPHPVNTFFVKPRNGTGNVIPKYRPPNPNANPPDPGEHGIRARFRIANWGSTPTGGTATWVDVPQGGDVRNVPIPSVTTGDIPANGQGEMRFNWTVLDVPGGPQFLTDFLAGTRREHQCVLVELSGPGLTFSKNSVFQNMDVEQASTVTRDAEISIAGLAPAAGTHRDVYLYVQTLNMPESLRPPREPGPEDRLPPGPLVRQPEPQQPVDRSEPVADHPHDNDNDNGGGNGNGNGGNGGNLPPFQPPPGPPPPAWQDETRPVYVVHVWHATGEKVTGGDGVSREVLEPQTSFGHYLQHEGPLFGWNHKLTAPGLVEIAPDFYRVSVPNDGSVTVTTRVEALENPNDLRSLLAWLIALIRALWRLITGLFRRVIRAIRRLFGL